MTEELIIKKLTEIFQDIFEDNNLIPNLSTQAPDVKAWDSLGNIRMCVAVEELFGIKFSISDIEKAFREDVGSLVQVIHNKLAP